MTAHRQRVNNPIQDYKPSVAEEDLDLPLFEFNTIATATNNFSFANKIGEGGYGPVYKVISRYIYELYGFIEVMMSCAPIYPVAEL